MKYLQPSPERLLAILLTVFMVAPLCAQETSAGQVSPQSAGASVGTASPVAPGSSTSASQSAQSQASQQTPEANTQQNPAPPATGTALAPYEKQQGITGSKPAGAAIAAGKQRRTRTFAIRAALIAGAVIAIGVVAGASLGSPARASGATSTAVPAN